MIVPALIPWLTTGTGGSSAQLNTFHILKSKALSKFIHLAEIQNSSQGENGGRVTEKVRFSLDLID